MLAQFISLFSLPVNKKKKNSKQKSRKTNLMLQVNHFVVPR